MKAILLISTDNINILRLQKNPFLSEDATIFFTDDINELFRLLETKDFALLLSDCRLLDKGANKFVKDVRDITSDTEMILMVEKDDPYASNKSFEMDEVFCLIQKPCDSDKLIQAVHEGLEYYRLAMELRNRNEVGLLSIAQTIESKDQHTLGHCDRVASYALMIADRLDLSEETKKQIKYGGWLHDCGKIKVPDTILNFPGRLSDAEYFTIRKHPLWGAKLARKARLSQTVINIISYHHECYDGAGYPHGLRGNNIPLEARIVAIADTFDAITSKRPYREPSPLDQAIKLMDALGGVDLDPDLMIIFQSAIC